MERFKRDMYEENSNELTSDERYNIAYKKVKKIKGFYSHLQVYLIVNMIIIILNLKKDFFEKGVYDSGLLDWDTYSTALFWGIGLLAHAFSVFGSDIFFSRDWEQRKIQKYMEKEASNTNKWE